ncbi:MAG: hypothetical protein INH34_10270 [Phycisphaerales bacterium]|jgi:hypothetical protein|nr:hypothetical protein [Phycisphaerales bacterium]
MNHRQLAAFLLLLLAGCASNYDFTQARLPDGGFDVPKLIADLKASGEPRLHHNAWLPLLHYEEVGFEPARGSSPAGYVLKTKTTLGPIYFATRDDERVVDSAGAPVESTTERRIGWGLLYNDKRRDIATTHGLRQHMEWHLLLFFGRTDSRFAEGKPAAAAATAPTTPAGAN